MVRDTNRDPYLYTYFTLGTGLVKIKVWENVIFLRGSIIFQRSLTKSPPLLKKKKKNRQPLPSHVTNKHRDFWDFQWSLLSLDNIRDHLII